MSLAITQQMSNTGTSTTSVTVTPGVAYTDGDDIIVLVRSVGSGASVSGITGGGATNWAVQKANNIVNVFITEIWKGTNVGGGSANVVVSLNATASAVAVAVMEMSAAISVDGVNGASGANGTSINSGNVTPTASADVVIVNCGSFQASTSSTAGPSGWTDTSGGAPTQNRPASYKLVPSASGSYNATYAIGYNNYAVSIAAFKASGGGGGGTSSPYYLSYYSRLVLGVID